MSSEQHTVSIEAIEEVLGAFSRQVEQTRNRFRDEVMLLQKQYKVPLPLIMQTVNLDPHTFSSYARIGGNTPTKT